ncbi:MAG: antibiotic biosynthesis monooxygenase [Bacteroidia bacterium]
MITRIVKMHFKAEEVDNFKQFFNTIKDKIESMPGLLNLKLYQDDENEAILFTISSWLNDQYLEEYRNSELFGLVWPRTKALFEQRPEAWSLKLK